MNNYKLLAAFLLALAPAMAADIDRPLGLQLESFKIKLGLDVPSGLDLVRSDGFTLVETAGTYKLTPEEFRTQLDAHGLRAVSSHFGYEALQSDLSKVIADARALGSANIVVANIPHKGAFTAEVARKAAADFNAWGKALKDAGMRFLYHPHGGEFQPLPEGGDGFDILMRETDPTLVFYEMDVFWVAYAGQDPVELLGKYPGRWKMFHLKDLMKGVPTGVFTGHAPIEDFVAIGAGQVDWPAVLAEGRKIGIEYSFIEDESADPTGNVRQSMSYLESIEPTPSRLHVVGNQLLDASGRPVRLRGVNCAGLEFSSDGEGHILQTVRVALEQWHANLIRLPLSQDRWFGKAPEQTDGGASYRALVQQVVDLVSGEGAYVILDLHWSDAGKWGQHIGQHELPDRNSVIFWTDFAPRFRSNPSVLFDLYNEPNRINWDQWYGGGALSEKDEKSGDQLDYVQVGLQELVRVIRAAGAKNVIVAGGINWSYETDGILQGHQLLDPSGDGVVYAEHPYPHAFPGIGRETIPQWSARVETLAMHFPILVTEFGSMERMWPFPAGSGYNDERWNREMLATLEEHGWNWTAWDFHPTAWPCLVSGWDYAPTPHFGVWVKQELAKNMSVPVPPPPQVTR